MSIDYRVEKEPLGTAGGVKACTDFIGGEDFLVISGDCICNFDLTACFKYHHDKNAEVKIVLYSHPDPLEYGLVDLRADGLIERFIEKPSWDRVHTNLIIRVSISSLIKSCMIFQMGRILILEKTFFLFS
jgi:mannose-1-phosphate guanylyltransferase/phosphomannomutase